MATRAANRVSFRARDRRFNIHRRARGKAPVSHVANPRQMSGCTPISLSTTCACPPKGRAQQRKIQSALEQREIPAVRRYHGRPMPAGGQRDQGIILELPTLVELPPFPIAHPTHESAGFPPVGSRRFPDDSCYAEQALDQLLCLASTSTSPEFGQNDSGVPDDESPADPARTATTEQPLRHSGGDAPFTPSHSILVADQTAVTTITSPAAGARDNVHESLPGQTPPAGFPPPTKARGFLTSIGSGKSWLNSIRTGGIFSRISACRRRRSSCISARRVARASGSMFLHSSCRARRVACASGSARGCADPKLAKSSVNTIKRVHVLHFIAICCSPSERMRAEYRLRVLWSSKRPAV